MDDLAAGGAVGVLFAELYNGASKLIRNYIQFEPLLGDLRTTLVTLNPLIQNIIAQNMLMHLPNEVTENLKTDIVEGIKLVEKYSKPGSMVDFLKKPTTYTTELRALDESLKKQLNMLQCYSLWVVNETYSLVTLVAKEMNVIPKDRLPNFTNNLVCYPMEDEASTSMMSGESRFKVLYDCLNEMTNKSTIHKSHFKGIVSTLDSLVPTIKMFEDYSDKLGMNQDILERFRMHTEQGIEAVQKYSKTSRLKLFRLNEYADLCRWEQSFQNQLEIMKEHIARDAKNYNVSVSVTNVTTVNQIQMNFIQAAQHGYNIGAWCEVPELPEFTVGLEMAVMDLKRMFFTDDKSVIGICGMGGVGKTTLAASFCRDQQVQDVFRNNIYFVTCGSSKANLSRIVQELYQSRGLEVPVFQNDVAAEKWFRKFIKDQAQSPLLLVVDDVWDDSLLYMIDFEIPNYKILLTSRRELDVPLKESQNQMVDAPSSGLVPNIDVSVAHSSEKDPIVDGKAGMKHILSVDAERHETEEPGQISSLGMQDLNQAMQRFQMLSTRLVEYEEHIKMLESKLSNYQTAEESWKLEKQKLENQPNFAMAQVKAGETNAADVTKDILGRLFRYVMENMNGSDTIAVDMEEKVLGFAGSIYINRDDVIEFKEMKPISAPCINVYMRHLFDVLMKQPNKDGVFCFWDASSIWEKQTPEEKSELLATRLHELPTKKICLIPYNTGNHWILTIINIEEDICYFMDPFHSAKYPEVWKSVVNNAIKKYKGSPSRHQSKETEWITLKGPKQPFHVECGYYVMRYMKEIVEDLTLSFAEKWGCGTIFSAYTKEEVDEVRFEWALLVYAYGRRRPLVSG